MATFLNSINSLLRKPCRRPESSLARVAYYHCGSLISGCDNIPDNTLRFLDGQSLGAVANGSETAPYVGIENFFLPAEIDNMLSGTSGGGSAQVPNAENPSSGDVWW